MFLTKGSLPTNNKIVWITLITPGFIEYAQNFFKSLQKNQIDFKVVVFCTTKECIEALKEFPSAVCINVETEVKEHSLMKWGDESYKQICFQKLDVLSTILELIHGDNNFDAVGYIDTDTIMINDISVIFSEQLQQYPNVDVFAQCDEGGEECFSHENCLVLCTGAIVFRNKINLIENLLTYKNEDVFTNSGDQEFLCKQLKRCKHILHRTISKQILLNGQHKYVRRHSNELPSTASLLHFNYMIGETKISNMKKRGVWLL